MKTLHVSEIKANEFLQESSQFRLGSLLTECPHPKTKDLSELAKNNLPLAFSILKEVDLDALETVGKNIQKIEVLRLQISETLVSGGRIFLCGCGATGRLSLALEVLWREQVDIDLADKVIAFMAGGDLALVRSIENFEDHPEYGAKQLDELGFSKNDLLVSCTEGGETPFVIGATERAAAISSRPPWFLYCNPDDILCEVAERSKNIIQNSKIQKINLTVGPMALSGSTRMQASTVLMLAVGVCLLPQDSCNPEKSIADFVSVVKNFDYEQIAPFTVAESATYLKGGFTVYQTQDYGLTILTDTTERSPTFSLRIFENRFDKNRIPSLCYLNIPGKANALDAYRHILHRAPRALEWEGVREVAGLERMLGFDFSDDGLSERTNLIATSQSKMKIDRLATSKIKWCYDDSLSLMTTHSARTLLQENLLLKVILNAHSTLIMGRIGRFEKNLMTYVKPSNKKLIDRTVRYVQIILSEKLGTKTVPDYEKIVHQCFLSQETLKENEPIVLKIIRDLGY